MRFGVRGRSPGQLQRPTGVTVDMNGDIIVADYDNRWISIFSSDGKFKVNSLSQEKKKTFFLYKWNIFHWSNCPSAYHRTKLVLEDWWDRKAWLWIRMGISSLLITRPAVSSSSNQMGSWWRSLEPEEHQIDTLQVLCATTSNLLYDNFINDISCYKRLRYTWTKQTMVLHVSGLVVGPDLQISFMFHALQDSSSEQIIIFLMISMFQPLFYSD